jgi:hypothetical protein
MESKLTADELRKLKADLLGDQEILRPNVGKHLHDRFYDYADAIDLAASLMDELAACKADLASEREVSAQHCADARAAWAKLEMVNAPSPPQMPDRVRQFLFDVDGAVCAIESKRIMGKSFTEELRRGMFYVSNFYAAPSGGSKGKQPCATCYGVPARIIALAPGGKCPDCAPVEPAGGKEKTRAIPGDGKGEG